MNITLKDTQHEKVERSGNSIIIDGCVYHNHNVIIGFIEDTYVEGRLVIEEKNLNFVQNEVAGSKPNNKDTVGFKYGWNFNINLYDSPKYSFISGVSLYNYKKNKNFNIQELEDKYPFPELYFNKYDRLYHKTSNISFFKVKEIEKCCGAVLLYDFNMDYTGIKEKYDSLTDEHIEDINNYIKNNLNSNKIVYLLTKSEQRSIDFLIEKLNFVIKDTFINKNTKNEIVILSRND